jgi:hypothetical protein
MYKNFPSDDELKKRYILQQKITLPNNLANVIYIYYNDN